METLWVWIRIPLVFSPWFYILAVFFHWASIVAPIFPTRQQEYDDEYDPDKSFPLLKISVAATIGVLMLLLMFLLKKGGGG